MRGVNEGCEFLTREERWREGGREGIGTIENRLIGGEGVDE